MSKSKQRVSKPDTPWKEARKKFKFLRLPQVQEMTGLSKPRIYTLMRDNRFPRAYKLSDRAVGWRDHDILEWQYSRAVA